MLFLSFLLASLLARSVKGDTCTEVEALSSIDVSRPLTLSYIDEQNEYWSTSCSALKPSCIIFPTTAAEVAAVINILNTNNEQFAIKSGGHNPNNYFASVDGGPLISTAKLDEVNLDPVTGIIRVGPGNRLDEVAAALDGTGWTFVGGRIGNTGVGGLVLGGGLSYMSAQYGWACSSVLEYELVLANGTILDVSQTSHPDLFIALRGGGNNFGVVTAYTVQGHPQGDIYGGNLVFLRTPAVDKKILKAVRDFTEYNTDDKAAVIVTAERASLNLVDSWILFLFYDGTVVPPGIFANFTGANPILNTLKVQSYADLMAGSNWVLIPGVNVQIGTETIPLPSVEHGEEVLEEIHAHWRSETTGEIATPGLVASIAYQPFPKAIARAARDRGGDLIDADDDHDRIIIEVNCHFTLPSDYPRMDQYLQDTYGGFREKVLQWQDEGKLPDDIYLPILMSYGFYRQDYFARLRPESEQLASDVAQAYDPTGFFRDRTGGWRP